MSKENNEQWLNYYKELKKYFRKHHDSNVRVSYVTENGIKLGKWLAKQRYLYSKNQLSEDRIRKLESLFVSWNYLEDRWNMHYSYLKEYYDQNGNCNVPQNYVTEDGVNLGIWFDEQRMAYKTGIMNKRRIKLLKDLNFKAHAKQGRWDEFYDALEKYYDKYGNANVTSGYITEDGLKLGNWITIQRQAYKNYKLDEEQAMLLNDLGVDWSKKDTSFLNKEITNSNEYKKVMLERMRHILEDLSYGAFGDINDEKAQVRIEKEIIKRMWR